MLKRLFLVIFILQSFATTAWAGMDMSQFNQAEKSQMQIMHHSMNMNENLQLEAAGETARQRTEQMVDEGRRGHRVGLIPGLVRARPYARLCTPPKPAHRAR